MFQSATYSSRSEHEPTGDGIGARPIGWPLLEESTLRPRTDRLISTAGVSFNSLSDEELLGRYRDQRRRNDFAELIGRHSVGLARYLARQVGDASLAEVILEETFLLIDTRCGLYRDCWPARTWIYAVAFHRAVEVRRRTVASQLAPRLRTVEDS